MRPFFAALVFALVVACIEAPATQAPTRKPDVGYVPTRQEVVDGMLELAGVKAGDVVYDLGCGDGRFVIGAAQRGARGVGVDIDPQRVKDANANVYRNRVGDRVKIVHQDMFLTTTAFLWTIPADAAQRAAAEEAAAGKR